MQCNGMGYAWVTEDDIPRVLHKTRRPCMLGHAWYYGIQSERNGSRIVLPRMSWLVLPLCVKVIGLVTVWLLPSLFPFQLENHLDDIKKARCLIKYSNCSVSVCVLCCFLTGVVVLNWSSLPLSTKVWHTI